MKYSVLLICLCLVGCGGGGGDNSDSQNSLIYEGSYVDAGAYSLGYTEAVLQIAQEAAEIIEILSIHPGNDIESSCTDGGSINIHLNDLDHDGKASLGDNIDVLYSECYRAAIQESLSGNISISVQENLNEQRYKLQMSFDSLRFIVSTSDSLSISGTVLVDFLNDGHTYSLDVSPGEDRFELVVTDANNMIKESFDSYRIAKTINLQTRHVEVSSEGQIHSPIFSAPVIFSTKEPLKSSLTNYPYNYPSELLLEFSSVGAFIGIVTIDAYYAIVSKLDQAGRSIDADSLELNYLLDGFLWENPLFDEEYPARHLHRDKVFGDWKEQELVSNSNAGHPKFAFEENKNIFAVWQQSDEDDRQNVYASQYIYDSGWGNAQLLDTTDAGHAISPRVVSDHKGNAVAVWTQNDGISINLWGAQFLNGQGWQSAELLETVDSLDVNNPEIEMDVNGNAIVVWAQSSNESYGIYSKRFLKDYGWQPVQEIASGNVWQGAPKISIASSGNALIAWRRESDIPSQFDLVGARFSPQSGWGVTEIIDHSEGYVFSHNVVMDRQGFGFAVWSRGDGSISNIMYNRFDPETGWQVAQLLENDDFGRASSPYLTLDQNMAPTVIWNQVMRTRYGGSSSQILMSKYDLETGWSSFERLSDEIDSATQPTISFDAKGNAIAQWYVIGEVGGRNLEFKRYSNNKWSDTQTLVVGVQRDSHTDAPLLKMLSSGETAAMWVAIRNSVRHIYSSIFE